MNFINKALSGFLWYRRFCGGKWYVYAWGGCEENYITFHRQPLQSARYEPLYVEDFW